MRRNIGRIISFAVCWSNRNKCDGVCAIEWRRRLREYALVKHCSICGFCSHVHRAAITIEPSE